MKKLLAIFLQFLLFLLTFAVGSFVHPFNQQRLVSQTATSSRVFIYDGLLLAVGVYLFILVIAAISGRLRFAALWTTLALLAAIAVAFPTGFVTHQF